MFGRMKLSRMPEGPIRRGCAGEVLHCVNPHRFPEQQAAEDAAA